MNSKKKVNCSAAWRKCCVVGFQPRLQVSHCKATWTTKITDFRRQWGSNCFLVNSIIRRYVMLVDKASYSLPFCLEISGVHFLSVQVIYLCKQLGLSHPPCPLVHPLLYTTLHHVFGNCLVYCKLASTQSIGSLIAFIFFLIKCFDNCSSKVEQKNFN